MARVASLRVAEAPSAAQGTPAAGSRAPARAGGGRPRRSCWKRGGGSGAARCGSLAPPVPAALPGAGSSQGSSVSPEPGRALDCSPACHRGSLGSRPGGCGRHAASRRWGGGERGRATRHGRAFGRDFPSEDCFRWRQKLPPPPALCAYGARTRFFGCLRPCESVIQSSFDGPTRAGVLQLKRLSLLHWLCGTKYGMLSSSTATFSFLLRGEVFFLGFLSQKRGGHL